MKCLDCGKNVGNWPGWLDRTSVPIRCSQCAGNGADAIKAPRLEAALSSTESVRPAEAVLEAA